MLCYLSGYRDEDTFEQPDRFRADRRPSANVSFGHGVHVCLGQHLARQDTSRRPIRPKRAAFPIFSRETWQRDLARAENREFADAGT